MTIYAISDLHFGHTNCIYKFREPDGRFMRQEFYVGGPREHGPEPTEHERRQGTRMMNDRIIESINATVKASDHLYIVGDVAIRRADLQLVKLLNCRHMTLIGGNHDIFRLKDYLEVGFKEVRGVRVISNVIFTHVPVHPDSLSRFVGNAHGHIHRKPSPAGPYLNLSCEVLNYTPIALEEIVMRLACLNPTVHVHEDEIKRMKEAAEENELLFE